MDLVIQMSAITKRYGPLKKKEVKKPPLKSIMENSENFFVDYTVVDRYNRSESEISSRPLHVLHQSRFELVPSAPTWVKDIKNKINNGKVKYDILGGALKDVILMDYGYTFYIPPPIYRDEKSYDYVARLQDYPDHLKKLAKKFGKLHEKVQARLNFAEYNEFNRDEQYIYSQEFVDDKGRTRQVTMTRIKLCGKQDLNTFIKSQKKERVTRKAKLEEFINLVYDSTKVLNILHRNDVYVLDIKPGNIFVCEDDKERQVFAFGDLDMAAICDKRFGNSSKNLCKSELASLMYLPSNAIMNPIPKNGGDSLRNLYGIQGYAIRDGYALSKTLLMAFNKWFMPYRILLLFENEGFQTDKYDPYQGIYDDAEYKQQFDFRRQLFIDDILKQVVNKSYPSKVEADQKFNQIKAVLESLWDLLYLTAVTGRPVGKKNRLRNWEEMIKPDGINEKIRQIKIAATEAGAKTFTRKTRRVLPSRKLTIFGVSEQEEYIKEPIQQLADDVEEMGVCWKGYRRNSKPRYSKGSCVKVKRRRKRRLKEELKF